MTATLDKLGSLHGRLADAMSEALTAETERIDMTRRLYAVELTDLDDGTAKRISDALTLAPTARVDNALLRTVASFLKDNSVTTDLSAGEDADETMATLNELHKKRRVATTPLDTIN